MSVHIKTVSSAIYVPFQVILFIGTPTGSQVYLAGQGRDKADFRKLPSWTPLVQLPGAHPGELWAHL